MSILAFQELTRRPIQPAPRVRADIEPSPNSIALPEKQQRLRIALDHRLDFGESAILQAVKCDQRHVV